MTKMTTLDVEIANLFEFKEKESIDDLFNDAFKDLAECQKSWDRMRAGKASTPTIETSTTGLVLEGEGGHIVDFYVGILSWTDISHSQGF